MFAMKSILSAAIISSAALAGTLGQRTANADVCAPIYIGQPSVISSVPVYGSTYTYAPVYAAPTYYTVPAPTVVYQSPYVYTTPDCGPQIIVRDYHDDHHNDRDHHMVVDRHDNDHHDYDRNDGHRR